MNSVNLTGRITKDPELKTGKDNSPYLFFCLAVDGGKDKEGNKYTDFIDCIAYKSQAEYIAKYIKKGAMLGISGRLHVSSREDSEGNKTKTITVKVNNVETLVRSPEDKPKETEAAPEDTGELPFNI